MARGGLERRRLVVIQVNGKLRARMTVEVDWRRRGAESVARRERTSEVHPGSRQKVVVVKNKLNIVI
jgi:hypothetical protein